jgi:PAS domain S-box-containing protein
MHFEKNDAGLQFLAGGGEMGALTRAKDWRKTPVGDPATWPQSLRTTLSILLNSKFPMFLWWGPELSCFYNDAYRPSLGTNGKHPSILGQSAKEAWPEIWSIIKPLIDQVLSGGESTWSEDQLIPIYRNGRLEDVYWTFSYSPVNDESGNVAGVLVTCNETTEKVRMLTELKEREDQFRQLADSLPNLVWTTDANGKQTFASKQWKIFTGLDPYDENTFQKMVHPDDLERITKIWTDCLSSGKRYLTQVRLKNKNGEYHWFNVNGEALKNEKGEIEKWVGTFSTIQEQKITEQSLTAALHKVEESEKRFRNTVKQAPLGITVLSGKDFVVEMANETYLQLIDKKEKDFVGRRLFDSLPEVKEIVDPLLTNVMTTGVAYTSTELSVTLKRYGKEEIAYFNLVYHPLREENKDISGIMVVAIEVTESVRAKHTLAESEIQFRNIAEKLNIVIDASELGTWEWNLQTNEIHYSGKYLEIFGYKDVFTFDHAKHVEHIHPDDRVVRDNAVTRALKKGTLDYKTRIIWNDGSIRWIEAKGKVFYDEQKQPVKLIGTVRDITEEKYRQQELFENEQRFRLLADSMPQHIWTADTEGNLNYYNQSVFDYTGLTLEQIDAEGWLQIVHPDDREENIRQWMESVVSGKDFLLEHRFRRHDGEYRWQLSRAIPQKNAEGNIQMWVGTSTDIHDQKAFTSELEKQVQERTRELTRLNESLAKSEERYHLMVEEVEDYAILYLNRNGIIENWNKGAEKIKGYRADEIIGKSFSIFYPEQERKDRLPETLLQQAVTNGKAIHEGWRVRKNGSLFWASVAITAVHDAQKNVIGFSKVTHDLTEKKAADDKLKANAEQLDQKNKDLEKMNAELQSFAYVSSHDLQEPLRKIQTFASRILSKEIQTLSENGKDYFRRMQEAAGRMQTLIQDLLAYSRTNSTDRAFEYIDLADIVNEVKSDIKETHTEKDAVIEVGAMCKVNIIPFQFRQLLYNLIGNAIKFSRQGITPHIIIQSEMVQGNTVKNLSLMPQKKYCHISVSDNGIGFDPQYKQRIFEVFQRLHNKEEYSGTGIGLAIVKKIVENHHGVITATSELNKGATFDIYIPEFIAK